MTSRELTSGFDFWSRGHLRMVVMHYPVKFDTDIFIESEVIDIFRNSRWRPISRLCKFGHSGVLIVWIWALYQICFKYLLQSLRSTHICFSRSFDEVTRINFRFRFLVTWSSPHGRDACSHKTWRRYLYVIQSYWHLTPPSWIFRLSELDHPGGLIVWYLCSVPNFVQLSLLVTEINALICFRGSFDDVTRINFRFLLSVMR